MLRLLIVDDSNFSQKVIANSIRKHIKKDVEFYFASDGQAGLDKFVEIKPDYVFVDLLMPKLNGKELIKMINDYDKDAKIIVLSADVQKKVREDVESLNILTFVNKPLNDEKVKSLCEMMVE